MVTRSAGSGGSRFDLAYLTGNRGRLCGCYCAAMIERILWLVLAAVHALPAAALFLPGLVTRLYGLSSAEPMFLLVQHRAGLFLCIVIACIWAMFDPAVRRLAVVITALSMMSFLVLYLFARSPSWLQTIALIDLAALPVLAASAYLAWKS